MTNIFKIMYGLVTTEMGKGQRIKSLERFVWLHFKFLSKKEYEFNWIEGLKLKAIYHWPGTTKCYYYGKYDRAEFTFLERYLRKNDIFLDVGSNIGSYALFCSKKCGCRSYAFEPAPETFAELQENISRNHLQNLIVAYNFALGDKESNVQFTTTLDMANHIIVNDSNVKAINTVNVKCKRLDEVVEYADVIKMDVEGFEPQAIRGADGILKSGKLNVIIVEVLRNLEDIEKELVDRYGYKRCGYDWKQNKIVTGNEQYLLTCGEADNYIYIKDIEKAKRRLESNA